MRGAARAYHIHIYEVIPRSSRLRLAWEKHFVMRCKWREWSVQPEGAVTTQSCRRLRGRGNVLGAKVTQWLRKCVVLLEIC